MKKLILALGASTLALTALAGPAGATPTGTGTPVSPETDSGKESVTVSRDSSRAIQVTHGKRSISIGTPANGKSFSVDTKTVSDGAQTIISLKDAAAPSSYDFPFTLPADTTLVAQPDGSVDIAQALAPGVTAVFGTIATPWATDATGKHLSTSFAVHGNTLTQSIDRTNAVYPIAADPHYVGGIWPQLKIYFNRSETQNVSAGGWVLAAALAYCGVCAGAAINTVAIVAYAGVYYSHGNCIKLFVYGPIVSWYEFPRDGGYCK